MLKILKYNYIIRTKTTLHKSRKFKYPDTPDPILDLTLKGLSPPRKHSESEKFPGEFQPNSNKGKIYDNKPFKIYLQQGQIYQWCTCGISHGQPICDGNHKRLDGTSFLKTRPIFRPLEFQVESSGYFYLCNCKQTNNRPFCDGTHRTAAVQQAFAPQKRD